LILINIYRFDITPKGQQIHISSNSPVPNEPTASRHPCFKLESVEKLNELRQRIWAHFERGGEGKPMAADKPGDIDSGKCFCLRLSSKREGRVWRKKKKKNVIHAKPLTGYRSERGGVPN
jgi:hypothetical protein